MKKSLCRVLSALFLCLLAVPAVHADSIVLPDGDPFFDRYGDDCEYLQRTYTANGPDGYVSLYKSPLSTQVREISPTARTCTAHRCTPTQAASSGAAYGAAHGMRMTRCAAGSG